LTGPIVLFDGVCQFCNASVNFLIERDKAGRIHFAALQSGLGQSLLARFGLDRHRIDSIVLVEGRRFSTESTAALRLTRYMDGVWPLFGVFLFVPAFLRDFGYEILARNRYRWFGRLDACRVPTPEIRQRFLE
jgi:predicted DCC family thiol-disulfide oxidoreductase YuxK